MTTFNAGIRRLGFHNPKAFFQPVKMGLIRDYSQQKKRSIRTRLESLQHARDMSKIRKKTPDSIQGLYSLSCNVSSEPLLIPVAISKFLRTKIHGIIFNLIYNKLSENKLFDQAPKLLIFSQELSGVINHRLELGLGAEIRRAGPRINKCLGTSDPEDFEKQLTSFVNRLESLATELANELFAEFQKCNVVAQATLGQPARSIPKQRGIIEAEPQHVLGDIHHKNTVIPNHEV